MTTLNLQTAFSDDATLRRVFTWLTKIGAGRHFGSLPIGWYQMHQCAAIDYLKSLAPTATGWRCKYGNIQARYDGGWKTVATPISVFQHADNKARQ